MKYRRAVLGDDWVEMKIPMSRALRDRLRIEARRKHRSMNSLINERLATHMAAREHSADTVKDFAGIPGLTAINPFE